MKIQRWKDEDIIGLIILAIGLIGISIGIAGIVLGFSYVAVQLLINPDISIIPKIVFSGLVLFIASIFILKGDD